MKFSTSVAYIWLVSAACAASLSYSFLHWQTQDWPRYIFYCAIVVPLETPHRVFGVLSLYHEDRDAFTEQDRDLLLNLGAKLANAMDRTKPVGRSV